MRMLRMVVVITLIAQSATSYAACNYASPGYALNRYIDQLDGTVQDRVTGLFWQRCDLGMTWDSNVKDCIGPSSLYVNWKGALDGTVQFNNEQLALSKPNNWRLPNIKELSTLVNLHCAYPAIDEETFRYPGSTYWSSTPFTLTVTTDVYDVNGLLSGYVDEHAAWNVNFLTGREQTQAVSTQAVIRLVRGVSKPVPQP